MKEFLEFAIPQGVGWPFFVVMLGIVFYGLRVAHVGQARFSRLLAEAVTQYKRDVHRVASEPPEAFLTRHVRPDALPRALGPIPGVLVTLGILGTFLGLGLAVGHAVPALRPDSGNAEVQRALHDLLQSVKFKFQNSAWGITFSLAFTAYGVVVERRLRAALENAAVQLQQHRRHLEDHLAEPLRVGIEQGFSALGNDLRDSLAKMAAGADTLATKAGVLEKSVTALATHVGDFGGRVEGAAHQLVTSSNQLGQLGGKIDASLKQMTTELGAQLSTATEKQQRSLDTSLKDLTTKLTASLDEMGKQAKTAASDQKSAARAQREALEGSLGTLATTVGELRTSLDHEMQRLAHYQSAGAVALEKLSLTMTKLQRHNEQLLDVIERVNAAGPAPEAPTPPAKRARSTATKTPGAADDYGF